MIYLLILSLVDGDHIWLWVTWAIDTLWILSEHDEDADTDDGLLHWDVTDGLSDIVLGWVAGLDHVTLPELHSLGTGGPHLAGDDDLATPSTSVHDEPDDAVGGTAGWHPLDELVPEALELVEGGETTLLDAVDEDLELLVLDEPALHDHEPELLKTAAVVVGELLGVRSLDDDFSAGWGGPNFAAAIALLSEFTGEELVKFGVEEAGLDDSTNLGAALRSHC